MNFLGYELDTFTSRAAVFCDCFALRAPVYCGVWFSDDLRGIDLVNLVVLVISEIGCFGIVD